MEEARKFGEAHQVAWTCLSSILLGLAWIFTPNSHLTFWGVGYRNFKTSARPSHQGIGVDF